MPEKRIYFRTDSDVGQAEFSKVFSKDGWLDKRIKKNKTNVFIYYAKLREYSGWLSCNSDTFLVWYPFTYFENHVLQQLLL